MGEGADEMSRKDEYGTNLGRTGTDDSGKGQLDPDDAPARDEDVTQIRHSIEQTRSDMSETIDELQQRLSPSHLKEQVREQVMEQYRQAKDSVREVTIGKVEDMVERVSDTMYEARRSMVDTVAANPIPSAMVAIGVAWLWMNRRDSQNTDFRYRNNYGRRERYADAGSRGGRWVSRSEVPDDRFGERYRDSSGDFANNAKDAVSDVAAQVQGRASSLAGKAKDTVSGVVNQTQQTAGYVVDQAQQQARRVEQGFNRAMEQSPLAVGAVALALGTAVGLAVPTTRKENEWMGEARDTVVGKAQALASDAIDKVQEMAGTESNQMASAGTDKQGSQRSGDFQ